MNGSELALLPVLAGLGLALAAGPLGCFVVWRRMAYFGDATAHAAILGVALSLALSLSLFLGVLLAALAMALSVFALSARSFSADTAIGVAAHGALACGLVAVSFMAGAPPDLEHYLFGDIAAVTPRDLSLIWGGAALILALILWRWRALLIATLSADLAAARGINPRREQLILILALALLVAVAIKIVGALLITAMLIIPAAAARSWAQSPERMALLAGIIGMLATVAGLAGAGHWGAPSGPSIVVAAVVIFLLAVLRPSKPV